MEVEQVKFQINSLIELILKFKGSADYTTHQYSSARATGAFDITDEQIHNVLSLLMGRTPIINFVISDIDWEETGNCVGDNLYPTICNAILLPDGERYYITISGIWENPYEYIYFIPKK